MIGLAMYVGTGLVLSLVMWAIATTTPEPFLEDASQLPLVRLLFLSVSLLEAGTLALFKFWMIPSGLSKASAAGAQAAEVPQGREQTVKIFGLELAPGQSQVPGKQSPPDYLFGMTLAMWAICEVPMILGFVVFTMGRQLLDIGIFWSLSLLLALVFVPRRWTWHDWIGRAAGKAQTATGTSKPSR